MSRTYQLYATANASADAVSYVEIASRCNILQIAYSMYADLDADGESANWEVSLVPYAQLSVNDARGPIMFVRSTARGPTDVGIMDVSKEGFIPMRLPVSAGQRIYASVEMTGTTSSNILLLIQTDEGSNF